MTTNRAAEAPTPSLNTALDDLVQALEQTDDLRGFRDGVRGYRVVLAATPIPDAAAVDVGRVWAAVDTIASIVLARREEHHHG